MTMTCLMSIADGAPSRINHTTTGVPGLFFLSYLFLRRRTEQWRPPLLSNASELVRTMMQARRCWVLLMVLVALPAGVLGFSASR